MGKISQEAIEAQQGVFSLCLCPIFPLPLPSWILVSGSCFIIHTYYKLRFFLLRRFEWRKKAPVDNLPGKKMFQFKMCCLDQSSPLHCELETQMLTTHLWWQSMTRTQYANWRKWDRSHSPSHFLSLCLRFRFIGFQDCEMRNPIEEIQGEAVYNGDDSWGIQWDTDFLIDIGLV